MNLKDKKIGILVEKDYEDLELWYPLLRLREEGATVDVIGPEAEKVYQSKHGYEVTSDVSIKNVTKEQYDCLVIPGGWAPDYLRRSAETVNLVRESYENGTTIAAICHGGSLLCSAGILNGRQVTSFHSIKHDMMNAGAVWIDNEVVRDNKLVTSRTPKDLPSFVKGIMDELQD